MSSPPARIFLLGTDEYGRDQFSRLLHGGRISLVAGLLAAGLAIACGLMIGAIAGFVGGGLDDALMRLAEVFLALPWLYLLFASGRCFRCTLRCATRSCCSSS